jgi:hypothetical protein
MTTTSPPPGTGGLPERPRIAATWYDVLDVPRDADIGAIQQAYDRAIALIEGKNLGAYFALDPAATATARRDIEAAFAILAADDRRHAYDRSLIGDDTDGPLTMASSASPSSTPPDVARPLKLPRSSTPRAALRFLAPVDGAPVDGAPVDGVPIDGAPVDGRTVEDVSTPASPPSPHEDHGFPSLPPSLPPPDASLPPLTLPPHAPRRIDLQATPTPTPPPGLIGLDGEVNGQTLRRLREYRGLSLDELAEATKIRRPYLAAIEAQDFEHLPSRVYLRGFLTQIARVLRVDKNRLADGYLAFIARFGG